MFLRSYRFRILIHDASALAQPATGIAFVTTQSAIAFVTTQSAMSNDKPLRIYAFLLSPL
ncbi:hypothetical protein [Nostoc sp.]|uniref:hypothetical protein n=1 Tax=Nostoc sp. TaxID=1180 RepID=UPI002FF23F65